MNEYRALISSYHWSSPAVSFSFMQTAPAYLAAGDPVRASFSPVSAPIQSYIAGLLSSSLNGNYSSLFSGVSGLTFNQSTGTGQIDIGSATTSNGRANGQYPLPQQEGGDIFLPKTMTATPSPGGYDHMAIMHEIGHAVGLEHGGAYAGGGTAPPLPHLPASLDSRAYSIMSYNPDPNAIGGAEPTGLQQFDIAALQVMYGVNYSTRSDDTEYAFVASPGIITIWDGGGIDRFDASSFTTGVAIDLNPGAFSSIGGTKNVAVALTEHLASQDQTKPLIEHARGGAGNDTIIGNVADNALEGRAGTNHLFGMAGNDLLLSKGLNDVLDGGAGNDLLFNLDSDGDTQYVFAKGYGHDAINDNPYSSDGITVFLRGLTANDIDVVVKRLDANQGNPDSEGPYYVYGDTYINVKDTGDTLLLPWIYRPDDFRDEFDYSGDYIKFENGTSWDMTGFESHTTFRDYSDEDAFFSVDMTLYAAQMNWDLTPYFTQTDLLTGF